jgi:hypothetical protein
MSHQQLQTPFISGNIVGANDHGGQALVVGPLRYVVAGGWGGGVDNEIGFERCFGGKLKCLGSLVDGHGWVTQRFEKLDAERSQAANADDSDRFAGLQLCCFNCAPYGGL